MTATLEQFGLDKLDADQRVELADLLLDSVGESADHHLSRNELSELEARYEEAIAHPEDDIPWETVKAEALARSVR